MLSRSAVKRTDRRLLHVDGNEYCTVGFFFSRLIVRKLPRYPVVPAALLGRLAVARSHQGRGLGGVLLADALKRSARAELGVFAMVVDAKDEAARRFYEHHGFTVLPGASRRLFLPIDTALQRLASR